MSMKVQDYLDLAAFFGRFSTCHRKAVGAIIVRDKRIISHGYNGAPSGMPHCGHEELYDDLTYCREAVHAEVNAVAFAAKYGISTDNTTMFVTVSPCLSCAQLLINSGVKEVIYAEEYRDHAGLQILKKAGVRVTEIKKSKVQAMSSPQEDDSGLRYREPTSGDKIQASSLGGRGAGVTGGDRGEIIFGSSWSVSGGSSEEGRSET